MGMRNKILEMGGKTILVTKWQRTWLNYVYVLVLYEKAECQCDKLGYLAEEISRQNFQNAA